MNTFLIVLQFAFKVIAMGPLPRVRSPRSSQISRRCLAKAIVAPMRWIQWPRSWYRITVNRILHQNRQVFNKSLWKMEIVLVTIAIVIWGTQCVPPSPDTRACGLQSKSALSPRHRSRHTNASDSIRSPSIAVGGPVFPSAQQFGTIRNVPAAFQSHEAINGPGLRQAPTPTINRPTVAPPRPPNIKPPPPPIRSVSNTNLTTLPFSVAPSAANTNNYGSASNVSTLKDQFSIKAQLAAPSSVNNVSMVAQSDNSVSAGNLSASKERSVNGAAPPLPPHRAFPAPPPPVRQTSIVCVSSELIAKTVCFNLHFSRFRRHRRRAVTTARHPFRWDTPQCAPTAPPRPSRQSSGPWWISSRQPPTFAPSGPSSTWRWSSADDFTTLRNFRHQHRSQYYIKCILVEMLKPQLVCYDFQLGIIINYNIFYFFFIINLSSLSLFSIMFFFFFLIWFWFCIFREKEKYTINKNWVEKSENCFQLVSVVWMPTNNVARAREMNALGCIFFFVSKLLGSIEKRKKKL